MELDTVLKFVGQGKEDEDGKSTSPIETLETMQQMGRFLAPTHQIVLDLKLRFISQIENQVSYESGVKMMLLQMRIKHILVEIHLM